LRPTRLSDRRSGGCGWFDQAEPERLESATQLDGGQQFPGLHIDLAEVWAG